MSATLVFFQKNPKVKPVIKAVLQLNGDKILATTATSVRPYRASLVTPEGHVLLANSEEFLKELGRQSKLSQVTYEYAEDVDKIAEYFALLQGG